MSDADRTPEQLIDTAREIAITLTLSQLGDNNDIGNLDAIEILERHADDTQLLYTVIRVMTASINVLATVLANDRDLTAAEITRKSINDVRFTAHPRDKDD